MRQLILLFLLLVAPALAHPSTLDLILSRGEIRVGATGDYPPFTHQQSDRHTGFDLDLIRLAAMELGVEVKIVPTTWPTLMDDLKSGRFDVAVGGVTRTLKRQTQAGFTRATVSIGKCPLVRRGEEQLFASLALVDQDGVRVAVNPGGTNEKYARDKLKRATIVTVADNLAIPDLIASGKVDLLITDNVEAARAANRDTRLAAVSADRPWTSESLGFLTQRDDQALLNWLNLFLEQAQADGTLDELRRQYQF